MKTLYVHIGQMKTGTSTLQHFCESNRSVLNKHGFDYPAFPYAFTNVGSSRNGHFLIGTFKDEQGQRLPERERACRERCLQLIALQFERYDNVLLSEEHLWHNPKGDTLPMWRWLQAQCQERGWELKLIVYLRRQDTYLASLRNQLVKAGNRRKLNRATWEEWVGNPEHVMLDYYANLQSLAAIVGRENIIVRVYDRAQLERDGGSLYADFLGCLGLQMESEYQLPALGTNTALTLNILEIHRLVTTAPGYRARYGETFREAARLCSVHTPAEQQPATLFAPEEARAFLAQFEEGNTRIAREYLHRDGPLFDPQVKQTRKWSSDDPNIRIDITRYFNTAYVLQQHALRGSHPSQELLQRVATRGSVPEALADDVSASQQKRPTHKHTPAANRALVRSLCEVFFMRERALQHHADPQEVDELTACYLPLGSVLLAQRHAGGDGTAEGDVGVADASGTTPGRAREAIASPGRALAALKRRLGKH